MSFLQRLFGRTTTATASDFTSFAILAASGPAGCEIAIAEWDALYKLLASKLVASGMTTRQAVDLVDERLIGVCPRCHIVSPGQGLQMISLMRHNNVAVGAPADAYRFLQGHCRTDSCPSKRILIFWKPDEDPGAIARLGRMGIAIRPKVAAAPPAVVVEAASIVEKTDFHDQPETRSETDFPLLREAVTLATKDTARALVLCRQQISETPDFTMPYLWVSNFQNSSGKAADAIKTLLEGLHSRKVSDVLTKMGVRLTEMGEASLAVHCLAKAILAQEPKRSYHETYLYWSHICRAAGFGDLANRAAAIAQKLYFGVDLNDRTISELKSLIAPRAPQLVPLLRTYSLKMVEDDRL